MSASTPQARLNVPQKVLLIAGLLWALLVIVPDFYRLYAPLGSLGFSADNSGIIYEVYDAPADAVAVPGDSKRGLKEGDRLALTPAACTQPASDLCRNFLAVFGGMGGL